jgi:hypothetical protein
MSPSRDPCVLPVKDVRTEPAITNREAHVIIGVPKEIKPLENRVAMTPGGVAALATAGHRVIVEKGPASGVAFPTRITSRPVPRLSIPMSRYSGRPR